MLKALSHMLAGNVASGHKSLWKNDSEARNPTGSALHCSVKLLCRLMGGGNFSQRAESYRSNEGASGEQVTAFISPPFPCHLKGSRGTAAKLEKVEIVSRALCFNS